MRQSVVLALAAALASGAAAIRQPYEYLEALTRFQEAYVSFRPADASTASSPCTPSIRFLDPQTVMEYGHLDLLADDMVGRVDVTTSASPERRIDIPDRVR